MKYCRNCGAEVEDNAVVCLKCGCYTEEMHKVNTTPDTVNGGLVFLSIILPIFGIIYWAVMKENKPIGAAACGKAALVMIVINFILGFVGSCIVISSMGGF